MATDFHTRVCRVLEAAIQRRTTDRDLFIAQAAGSDTAVLREVQSLLPHYLKVAGFEPKRPSGTRWRLPGTITLARAAEACHDDVEWEPPFSVAPYSVVDVLGRGGMGVVYRGIQPFCGTDVAIKVLRRPCFVMEYVHGGPLLSYADKHGLDALQRLGLLAEICEAVEYAHHHAIIHRDLKPDNILVDEAGRPRILDFGIARLQHFGGRTMDEAKNFVGTPAYASPEQRAGCTSALSPASDVYALGLIAHELLTGRLPRRTRGRLFLDLRNVRVTGSGPSPAGRDDEFRYALRVILATTLREARGQRYASAGELGADLAEIRQLFSAPGGRHVIAKRLTALCRERSTSSPTHSRLLCALLRKRIGLAIDAEDYK